MLIPALRRFALLLVAIAICTAVMSMLFGLLLGASLARSITIGFYLMGCFLLLAGFLFGNRGPVRPKGEADAVAGDIFFRLGSRRLRWATSEEQKEAINTSAVYLPIGFILILLGVASDSQHALF
jgi:hypothetical protein